MISVEDLRNAFKGCTELDATTLARKYKRLTGRTIEVPGLEAWLDKECQAGALRVRISLKDPVEFSELRSFEDITLYETFKKSQNPLRNNITSETYSVEEVLHQKHYRLVNPNFVFRGLVDIAKEDLASCIIFGCDTVGFSKELTSTQLVQFRHLTHEISLALNNAAFGSNEVFAIPTGDGYFVIINDAEAERCLRFVEHLTKGIRDKSLKLPLRIGLHTGTIYQIQTPEGGMNAIGHSLNSCARIMSYGSEGHILCSGTFYSTFIDHSDFQHSFHYVGEGIDKHRYTYKVFNFYKDSVGNPTGPSLSLQDA